MRSATLFFDVSRGVSNMPKGISRRNVLKLGTTAAIGFAAPTVISTRRVRAAETVRVGSLLDQTGPINISGLPAVAGTKFAIDEINKSGGLLGQQLELVQYDTQS